MQQVLTWLGLRAIIYYLTDSRRAVVGILHSALSAFYSMACGPKGTTGEDGLGSGWGWVGYLSVLRYFRVR